MDHQYYTHSQAPFSMNPHTYQLGDAASFGPAYDGYDERNGYSSMTAFNAEEGEIGGRTRLSQEQWAQLEREFMQQYKPNTEYKKGLAEQMGVEYQRINNWFQNRRAKAKHQNPQEPKFDVSLDDENVRPPAVDFHGFEYSNLPEIPSNYSSSPPQASILPGEVATGFEYQQYHGLNFNFNSNLDAFGNDLVRADYGPDSDNVTNFSDTATDSLWSTAGLCVDSLSKIPGPTILEFDSFGFSPESPSARFHETEYVQAGLNSHSHPMYHGTLDGQFVGNPSSQTFVTTSSEEGHPADLITPPQETSPLPTINQGVSEHERKSSNSSDLAQNLDTVHLQQPQVGLSVYENSNSSGVPKASSATGLTTPEVSPDTVVTKSPFARGNDLASRRKRPRLPALQPDSSRSASYSTPTTTSPHLRLSPPNSGKMSPVRRIKSTGNNLSVLTGRVKKQGTVSAQMSPRNFESYFQAAASSEAQKQVGEDMRTYQTSAAETVSSTPTPSATYVQKPSSTWPNISPYDSVPSTWDASIENHPPASYPQSLGLSLTPSPPHHARNLQSITFEQYGPHQPTAYSCPPQSAPPHMTSFFDPSPPIRTHVFHPPSWPTPSVTPPEPYGDDSHMSVPIRPSHPLHHSHSGPLNFFGGPSHTFQGVPAVITPFQPYQSAFHNTPPPVQEELQIKLEVGCPPPKELAQTTQENKTYTFNHSTPRDFRSTTNGKK